MLASGGSAGTVRLWETASGPVRSEFTYMLVRLDKEFALQNPTENWEDFYAARLVQHFVTRG
jgi:hypothetical protein